MNVMGDVARDIRFLRRICAIGLSGTFAGRVCNNASVDVRRVHFVGSTDLGSFSRDSGKCVRWRGRLGRIKNMFKKQYCLFVLVLSGRDMPFSISGRLGGWGQIGHKGRHNEMSLDSVRIVFVGDGSGHGLNRHVV